LNSKSLIIIFVLVVGVIGGSLYYYFSLPSESPIVPTGITKAFSLSSENFVFNVTTIEVDAGDTVEITITALDNGGGEGHGITFSDFAFTLPPGEVGVPRTGQFLADKVGEFTYKCTVNCGNGHTTMIGTLVVNAVS
jgi:cytochrome c oxidase subunit 2